MTKGREHGRKRALWFATLFPWACFAWAAVWFVCYAAVNVGLLHRDLGIGDGGRTPLPNGYVLEWIDVMDDGYVDNARTQGENGLGSGPDSHAGVRRLQLAGPLILGAADSQYVTSAGTDSTHEDEYFILDTTKGTQTRFRNEGELRKAAASQGITLQLNPFAEVFGEYRDTWFDSTAFALLLGLPLVAFALLLRFVLRVRRGVVRPVVSLPN